MCGRTACSLSKDCLRVACEYRDGSGNYRCPEWRDVSLEGTYEPSYNMPPQSFCPVLVHNSQLGAETTSERIVTSMKWGLVPSWYQSDPADFKVNTINCRIEGATSRKCYLPAITAGHRCVVIAEGYFEWQKPSKQAFFVYCQQKPENSMATRPWDCQEMEDVLIYNGHWQGPKLLTMAGLFDINKGHYSFTILTRSAPPYLRWLHDRAPVILDNEDAVASWLDPARDFNALIRSLTVQSPTVLDWHQVPDLVGNVNNKGKQCVLPMQKPKPRPTLMDTWLTRSSRSGGEGPSTSHRSRSRSPVKGDEVPKSEVA
ncbi:abasic site processing protein HMCES-like [Dermacentor silvarum]|uniref:abasic site processing protein HMCES-like n=1 Tax=Dermacentor silvarum TaxID=543639 RepID=UPI002101CE8E|nr:abasic site processing protein HMCES-like [Dermacentor silvarum]